MVKNNTIFLICIASVLQNRERERSNLTAKKRRRGVPKGTQGGVDVAVWKNCKLSFTVLECACYSHRNKKLYPVLLYQPHWPNPFWFK